MLGCWCINVEGRVIGMVLGSCMLVSEKLVLFSLVGLMLSSIVSIVLFLVSCWCSVGRFVRLVVSWFLVFNILIIVLVLVCCCELVRWMLCLFLISSVCLVMMWLFSVVMVSICSMIWVVMMRCVVLVLCCWVLVCVVVCFIVWWMLLNRLRL